MDDKNILKYDEIIKIVPTMIREPMIALKVLNDIGYRLHADCSSDDSSCQTKEPLFSIGIVIINQLLDMSTHCKIDWIAKIHESGDEISYLMKDIMKWDYARKFGNKKESPIKE